MKMSLKVMLKVQKIATEKKWSMMKKRKKRKRRRKKKMM